MESFSSLSRFSLREIPEHAHDQDDEPPENKMPAGVLFQNDSKFRTGVVPSLQVQMKGRSPQRNRFHDAEFPDFRATGGLDLETAAHCLSFPATGRDRGSVHNSGPGPGPFRPPEDRLCSPVWPVSPH